MYYYIRPTMFPLRCTMRTTRLGGIKSLRFRWWFPPRALPPWWYERPPPSQSSNSLFGNLSMSSSLLGITPSAFRALISLCMRETTHGAQHNAVAKSVLSNIPSRCSATALEPCTRWVLLDAYGRWARFGLPCRGTLRGAGVASAPFPDLGLSCLSKLEPYVVLSRHLTA